MPARIPDAQGRASSDRSPSRLAVLSVVREHRRRRRASRVEAGRGEAVETEILAILYGDAAARHRAYDTQPSHSWPVAMAAASKIKPRNDSSPS
jgi:hypothetical protein